MPESESQERSTAARGDPRAASREGEPPRVGRAIAPGLVLAGVLALVGVSVTWLRQPPATAPAIPSALDLHAAAEATARAEPIAPLPAPPPQDPALVALGERLFFEARLSIDGTTSCASCHVLTEGGDDGLPVSMGVDGRTGAFNAPTVLNAALNFRQFWDGRAASLEEQVDGPLQNEHEMGGSWEHVLATLRNDADYRRDFAALYDGSPPHADGVRDALAAFQRTLLTAGAPIDRYLRGDEAALSERQRRGYELFKEAGCAACHQGANVGGNMFQTFGVMGDYFADRGDPTPADLGRFAVTGREEDRYVFKVPSLRNVALTAPYFHDGSAASLPEAVSTMARYQLGQAMPAANVALIVEFLDSLTGRIPTAPMGRP